MLCSRQAPSIPKRSTCNQLHCTGRKGGGGGRVTLIYQLIFLPRVPKSPWRSSRTCDLQTDMMHGCKNGRAYAQSPAEQSEVLGTIFCSLCYRKSYWFETVCRSMSEQDLIPEFTVQEEADENSLKEEYRKSLPPTPPELYGS